MTIEFIDIGANLTHESFDQDREQVLENARSQRNSKPPGLYRGADGPGRSEYVNQEKAAQGPLNKLKPKKASPVASKPSPAKKLKKGKNWVKGRYKVEVRGRYELKIWIPGSWR